MFLHGFHAMAGAEKGVLSHSFMPMMENIWLNDLKIGEIALNMLGFGELGIRTVFVSGDQAAVDESKALVPEIETAVVKWGLEEKHKLGALSVRKAISLSPGKAQQLVKVCAKKAMKKIGEVEPFRLDPPYTMTVEYTEEKYAEGALQHEGVERINDTTITQIKQRLSDLVF
jgi:D-amino peptidase